jgi:hypothetical protein
MKTNRFVLFAGDDYYPSGGWDDFVASYETFGDALRQAANIERDWWQIVDLEGGNIVDHKV